MCSRTAFRRDIFEGGGADGHHLLEAIETIAACIPEMRDGAGGAERAGVLIGEVEKSAGEGVAENFIEQRSFIFLVGEIAVAVGD